MEFQEALEVLLRTLVEANHVVLGNVVDLVRTDLVNLGLLLLGNVRLVDIDRIA